MTYRAVLIPEEVVETDPLPDAGDSDLASSRLRYPHRRLILHLYHHLSISISLLSPAYLISP